MVYMGMEEDRRFLQASASELDQYLSSNVLMWRMARLEIPLTPGNLLLIMRRLKSHGSTDFDETTEKIRVFLETRRAAWEKKTKQELTMRVNQWNDLVEEMKRYGKIDASYSFAVRTRVIISMLQSQLRFPDLELEEKISKADREILLLTKPGDFVWDSGLVNQFPADEYPFLYVKDKKE